MITPATTVFPLGMSDNDIASPLPAYARYMQDLQLVRDLHRGTVGMRKAGQRYLPQEEGESLKNYQSRLKRSVLTNNYKRTLEKLAGQVFSEDIEPSNDLPDAVYELLPNIDLEGSSISTFMYNAFYAAMHKGVCHVMVEYPQVQGNTRADHLRAGARPYWTLIDPECVIGWRHQYLGGRKVLTQLRVLETVEVESGKYGVETVQRLRLYEPGRWKVFQLDTKSSDWREALDPETGQVMEGTTSLDYIPLVTLMLGERTSEMTAIPCLQGLAELNCLHWQSASDQRNILHYARLITFFGKCLDVDEGGQVIFGANRLIHTTSPDGDLRVVEHSGQGIEAGRNDLKDLEAAMALFGLQLLLPKVSGQTATQNAIEKGEADSALLAWTRQMQSCLQTLLSYTCDWLGINAQGELVPYTGFADSFASTDTQVLLEGFKAGLLPRELVIGELKERGVIGTDYDMIEVARMFEEDARASSMMPSSRFSGQESSITQNAGETASEAGA